MGCPKPGLPSSWKLYLFTSNLIAGLILSQVLGALLDTHSYEAWMEIVTGITMWCLCFIMINVGYEFTIDKNALGDYGVDYLIAMTAAGFPWMFVGLYFFLVVGSGDMPFPEALLIARFAAPTSAGILFSMLDAAGLKETWLFDKGRILAIFDDLDTIILMIPLKIVLVGMKWELSISIGIMIVLLVLAWTKLHALPFPYSWRWTLLYAAVIAFLCKMLHYSTHHWIHDMEAVHIEVLLPAFVLGALIDTPGARVELAHQQRLSIKRHSTQMELGTPSQDTNASSRAKSSAAEVEIDVKDNEEPKDPSGKFLSPMAAWPDSDSQQNRSGSKQSGNSQQNRSGSKQSGNSAHSNMSKVSKSSKQKTRYGLPIPDTLVSSQAEPEVEPSCLESEQGAEIVEADYEEQVQTGMCAVFMCLVGLSMPALLGNNAKDNSGGLGAGEIVLHVIAVSILMIAGKMFPVLCYRSEAKLKDRFALCLGMCPRGEVGASIIVISLELGVEGPAIIIAMCALGGNLVMSGAFISAVKYLVRRDVGDVGGAVSGAAVIVHDVPDETLRDASRGSPTGDFEGAVVVEDFP